MGVRPEFNRNRIPIEAMEMDTLQGVGNLLHQAQYLLVQVYPLPGGLPPRPGYAPPEAYMGEQAPTPIAGYFSVYRRAWLPRYSPSPPHPRQSQQGSPSAWTGDQNSNRQSHWHALDVPQPLQPIPRGDATSLGLSTMI